MKKPWRLLIIPGSGFVSASVANGFIRYISFLAGVEPASEAMVAASVFAGGIACVAGVFFVMILEDK